MEETVCSVSKVATEELEISLFTPDRMSRNGEVKVRPGGPLDVRADARPHYITDDELLKRTAIRLDESERTVRELRQEASELEWRISELEGEQGRGQERCNCWRRSVPQAGGGLLSGKGRPREDKAMDSPAGPDHRRDIPAAGGQRPGGVVSAGVGEDRAPGCSTQEPLISCQTTLRPNLGLFWKRQ